VEAGIRAVDVGETPVLISCRSHVLVMKYN
jgi:hypothetical protein